MKRNMTTRILAWQMSLAWTGGVAMADEALPCREVFAKRIILLPNGAGRLRC
ncbi:hypothetical protein [Haloferula sp.]|uniref:hypothetical protein n=1 Tax=Haloferula sp. TaxID=2497595 RepID=UPI003C710850